MRQRQTLRRSAGSALTALALFLSATAAPADGFVLGAGRWTCAEVTGAIDDGDPSLVGQAAGWVFGYWTAATFARETRFVDIVEEVGGEAIWQKTVAECRRAAPETFLYLVANSMISNTK